VQFFSKLFSLFAGIGSELRVSVDAIATLHVLVNEMKRHFGLEKIRMLDVPCGDMQYMPQFLESRNDVDYTGVDIVEELIDRHREKYARHPWIFRKTDIVADSSFVNNYDLIVSRSMLQHLNNDAIFKIFNKFSVQTRHPSFLLVTTFSNLRSNIDLDTSRYGRFRPVNLELPPFRLEPPLCMFRDGPYRKKLTNFMGLWRLPLMSTSVSDCKRNEMFNASINKGMFYSCVNWELRTIHVHHNKAEREQ